MLDIFDLALKLERARELKQAGREMGLEPSSRSEKSYTAVLKQIKADFDRHLRFMGEGLRSVARASSDSRSAKWDILAEMLQSGSQDERR
jgi:gamma-tubulin complex component 5